MKEIFLDSNKKLSFGRIMGFASIICAIVLFAVALSYNWHERNVQAQIFDLVKFMWGAGAGTYGISKITDIFNGKTKKNSLQIILRKLLN